MNIMDRYFSKEFIKLILLCLFIFFSIFLVIDFVQKIDNFIEAEVSKGVIFSYFLYKTPFVILQMIPVATLISIIILFCLFKKNNEILAMKACGLNLYKLSQSVIVISFFISIIAFLFSELIVPYTSTKSNEIWDIEVLKQDPTRFYGSNQIWYRTPDAIYWIRHFDSERNIMLNPTFYFFDQDFRLVKRIDARVGIWQQGIWKIEDGIVQKREGDGNYDLRKFRELFLEIPENPDTFVRKIKKPEDMNFQQLKNYSERIRNEGYDNTRYLVDMNIKLAFPLISLVLAILGIPIALKLKVGGLPLAVAIGIGLCFLYMITFSFSRSLGISGVLPPILSAWTANFIFILFGFYLMMGIER